MKCLLTIISSLLISITVQAKGIDSTLYSTNHVFFLHNKVLEDMSDSAYNSDYGAYEYSSIINALKGRGYTVYAERRPYGTDADHYSWLVAKKVDSLLKLGVAAESITVVGTGKGALITMLTSAHVRDKNVRYVVLSGCNELVAQYFHIDMHGTFLSVHEKTDYVWVSCEEIKEASKGVYRFKEVELNTGLSNGYLYKPLDEWLSLVYQWVEM